jgi:NitT/TauT family transport system permease protein
MSEMPTHQQAKQLTAGLWQDYGASLLLFVILTAVIEFVIVWAKIPSFMMPRPSAVITRMYTDAGVLLPATWYTTREIVAGFLLSIVVGVPMAIALSISKTVNSVLMPLLVAAQILPKVALAPIFVVWFGLGMSTKILMGVLLCFFPILIDTLVGLKSVDSGKVLMVRSFGAGPFAVFWRLRLPAALPSIFGGARVAVTLAIVGAIVAEFIGGAGGLGNFLLAANSNFDTIGSFAAIGYLTVTGLLLYSLVVLIERIAIPWHVSHRTTSNGSAKRRSV